MGRRRWVSAFPAQLRDLTGLKALSVRLPHQRLSDLRGRMPRATSRCAFVPLVNHVSFLCPPWLLIIIGGAYVE